MDKFVNKLPGTPGVKAFIAASFICGLLAMPVFGVSKEGRQGHDYFSQEKPEAIRSGEERKRKEERQQRGL